MTTLTTFRATLEYQGTEYGARLMRIQDTFLGVEDHGIFTFILRCQAGSIGMGVGTYGLDAYDKEVSERVPTAMGLGLVMEVIRVAGVQCWEKLRSTDILVLSQGNDSTARGIANRYGTRVLIFSEYINRFRNKAS